MKRAAGMLLVSGLLGANATAAADSRARFFVMGSGELKIRAADGGPSFAGRYRATDGRYSEPALAAINRVFGTVLGRPGAEVSLRLIERLSRLRADLGGNWVILSSGYRSPQHNRRLRQRGTATATTSLHQYGMAADLRITGVRARSIWRYMRRHGMGGVGNYGNGWIHVDTGPPRAWTVHPIRRTPRSAHNKLLRLRARYDIYRAGDLLAMQLIRITAFPIGIERSWRLERARGRRKWDPISEFTPEHPRSSQQRCQHFDAIAAVSQFSWRLPANLKRGRYRVAIRFCEIRYRRMRRATATRSFIIR